jgi:hypothetical protein
VTGEGRGSSYVEVLIPARTAALALMIARDHVVEDRIQKIDKAGVTFEIT